ncbi:Repressor protein c2 [Pseudomonas sp. 8Z]|nr:Repressor protein c2 [Pseudomonas sp. 8Z]
MRGSGAVALLEFLLAAARAGIVAADILQRVAYRLLMAVIAMRAMHMTVIVMVMIMVVVAVGAVDVGLVAHEGYSGMKSPGIISPLRDMCTLRLKSMPVFTSPLRV